MNSDEDVSSSIEMMPRAWPVIVKRKPLTLQNIKVVVQDEPTDELDKVFIQVTSASSRDLFLSDIGTVMLPEKLTAWQQRCDDILCTLLKDGDNQPPGSSCADLFDAPAQMEDEIVTLAFVCENLTLDVSEMEHRCASIASEYAHLLTAYEIKCATLRATKDHNMSLQYKLTQVEQTHRDTATKLYAIQCAYAHYRIREPISYS